MKRVLLLMGVILGVLNASASVSGTELPHISVIGEARELVAPDQMNWNVRIRNEGSAVNTVAEKQSRLVKEVIHYLIQSGIKEKQVQTSNMQLSENWIYKKGTRVKQGYFAATTIVFKSRDLKKYERLWIGLSALENLNIKGVGYELSDRGGYLNRLRNQALTNARRKAVSMASTLDAEIGEPLVIEEISPAASQAVYQRTAKPVMMTQEMAGDSMSMPGLIPVYLSVRVKFRLISFNTP